MGQKGWPLARKSSKDKMYMYRGLQRVSIDTMIDKPGYLNIEEISMTCRPVKVGSSATLDQTRDFTF